MTESRHPRPKVLPPVWLIITMILISAMDYWLPLATMIPGHLGKPAAGASLIGGLVLIGVSAGMFSKADTGIIPFDEARALVTGGFYRYTRNPMYLGMALILLGTSFAAGSIGSVLPVPFFVWVIQRNFIVPEERFLEEAFGQEYRDYCRRVRRWL